LGVLKLGRSYAVGEGTFVCKTRTERGTEPQHFTMADALVLPVCKVLCDWVLLLFLCQSIIYTLDIKFKTHPNEVIRVVTID
jgi:hypothetical protein